MSQAYEDYQEGWRRLRSGQTAQATVPLEKARRAEPQKASIREALGIAYFRLRRWEDAEAEFRAVLEDLACQRLRALRPRPLPRQARARSRGAGALQARPVAETRDAPLRSAHPRRRVRAVVQRVTSASVTPGSAIGRGVCVLLGIARDDDDTQAERLAGKIARLRIFENDDGNLDRSLLDVGGAALVVSQFTLIADTAKGNRPSFTDAASPGLAEPLYEAFCEELKVQASP